MINCPICNSLTSFLVTKKDRFGQEYNYIKCQTCGFAFDKDLVENKVELAKKVSATYQKDYFQTVDMGWQARGDGFLKVIKKVAKVYQFLKGNKKIQLLDYGGGNGYIAAELSKHTKVLYYDKYDKPIIAGSYTVLEKPIKTDIIYAVELVEHLTDLNEWDFLSELSPGMFIFTTCLTDNIKKEDLQNWEYLNPDAGHTALYSTKSLYILAKKYGFVYFFFPSISCHFFIKNRFLGRINFIRIEYVVYNFFRSFKHFLK